MNLNQTLCACECVNTKCKKNMGMSHVRAAEARGLNPQEDLTWDDLSENCNDYKKESKDGQ